MQLPAVAIVSRDVGAAYALQLDLAEPRSSLVTLLCWASHKLRPLGLHEFGTVSGGNATLIKI